MSSRNIQSLRKYDWLEDALLSVCRSAFPSEASLRIHSLSKKIHRVSAHKDYEFFLESPDTEIRLKLRLHHGLFSLWGVSDRIKPAREYSAMLHAYQAGVPAPFPYGFTTSEQPFGKPYLLHDPGDGEYWWESGDSMRIAQEETVNELAEELVKLHCAAAANHPLIPSVDIHTVLKQLWNRVSKIAGSDLAECFVKCRKEFQNIETLPDVMLHGQFEIDHVMLQGKRIRTITDWEHAAFGDPRWDIAYTSLSFQRDRERSLSNQFLSRYSQLAEMDIDHIHFWEGLVALREWSHCVWLRSLDEKSFESVAGLQSPAFNQEDRMRKKALSLFG